MKKIFLITLLVLFTMKVFPQAFYINPIKVDPIKKAEELYMANQCEESLNILNQVISQNPNNMYALLDRSCVLDALGEYEKALQDIEIVIKNEPHNLKAHHIRGAIYENMGLHEKAIDDENYVLEKVSTFSSGLNVRGMAYGRLGLYEKSLKDFTDAVTNALIQNEYAEPYFLNRAYTYYFMKRYDEALSDIENAIMLNDKNPESFILKSLIFRLKGEIEESIKLVSEAINIRPDYYEVYYLRIIDYLQSRQYKKAKRDLEYIKIPMSDYSAYHSLLAIYYYLIGDDDRAKEEYKLSSAMSSEEKNSFVIKIIADDIEGYVKNRKFDFIEIK